VTAFVILAAGAGTRMGRSGGGLHKALVPLGGQAVISRQIALAPPGARVIVCTGSQGEQVRDYLELAHPELEVTFADVPGWDQPGNGPGASLLAARPRIGDDHLVFASCDTLWQEDASLWTAQESWAGVAPVPAGTELDRWCRIYAHDGRALSVYEKTQKPFGGEAYTGLAMILQRDLPLFWHGIEEAAVYRGAERQVTPGLAALTREKTLTVRRLAWTDTGDAAAYARAVAAWSGYDWAKPEEVTYVLPDQGRVVKYRADQDSLIRRARRQLLIANAVPGVTGSRPGLLAFEYVPGVTGYEAAEKDPDLIPRLLDWATEHLWWPVPGYELSAPGTCDLFYRVKTRDRIAMLPESLQPVARHAASLVEWKELEDNCVPVNFHGDFNLGNVIVTPDGGFAGIDWREDFAGQTEWGDYRYDLAKLAAGLVVHWGNARRGDFRPWKAGAAHLEKMASWLGGEIPHDVRVLAAVSLLNCAPLHASPLDEILVVRAAALLEGLS
jgi:NDP-sugar pyrophosphorylase family protein